MRDIKKKRLRWIRGEKGLGRAYLFLKKSTYPSKREDRPTILLKYGEKTFSVLFLYRPGNMEGASNITRVRIPLKRNIPSAPAVDEGGLDVAEGGLDVGEGGVDVGEGRLDVGEGGLDVGEGGIDVGEGGLDVVEGGLDVGEGGLDVGEGGLDVSEGGIDVGEGGLDVRANETASTPSPSTTPGTIPCSFRVEVSMMATELLAEAGDTSQRPDKNNGREVPGK